MLINRRMQQRTEVGGKRFTPNSLVAVSVRRRFFTAHNHAPEKIGLYRSRKDIGICSKNYLPRTWPSGHAAFESAFRRKVRSRSVGSASSPRLYPTCTSCRTVTAVIREAMHPGPPNPCGIILFSLFSIISSARALISPGSESLPRWLFAASFGNDSAGSRGSMRSKAKNLSVEICGEKHCSRKRTAEAQHWKHTVDCWLRHKRFFSIPYHFSHDFNSQNAIIIRRMLCTNRS